MRAKGSFDLLALVESEESRVDEDAGELIANRAVHERRGDRGIDTARQAADHARLSHLLRDLRHLVIDERAGGPRWLGAAHLEEKVRDHFAAARRVRHFGVKL